MGLLHLGITQKERRFRKKLLRFLRSNCFFVIFEVEILRISFLCSFCIVVSSLAVSLYGYRSYYLRANAHTAHLVLCTVQITNLRSHSNLHAPRLCEHRLVCVWLSADAFCSKSVRPKVLISLRIRKSCNYNRALPIYHWYAWILNETAPFSLYIFNKVICIMCRKCRLDLKC